MEQNYDIHKAIPQLRFPEFQNDGEWKFVHGNELFEPIVNKNHKSDLPVLAITQDQGAVPREMIDYKVLVSEKSLAGYKVVEIGDFIISLRSFQGGIEYSNYRGLCSPAYIVLRRKNDSIWNDFYRHYFKSDKFIKDLNRNLEGIRDGKMISYQQFSEILLPYPTFAEQQRIAAALSEFDIMLSSTNEKLEQLKACKKGLMQKLFPAQGRTLPEYRFKEFEKDGNWEKKNLGDVADVFQGYGFPERMQGKNKGMYPFIKVSDISNAVNKGRIYITEAANYVDEQDIGILNAKPLPVGTIVFAKIGEAIRLNRRVVLKQKSLIDNNVAGIKAISDKSSDSFMFYIMTMIDLLKYAGGIVPAIKKSAIEEIGITIPVFLSEQCKVSSCLSSVDEAINAYTEKVARLTQYKKGLMQQIFPTPNK